MLKFKVKKDESGRRADIVISEHLPTYSRSSLKQLFSKGLVSINAVPIKASHKFTEGEVTKVDTTLLETQPSNIKIPIIYEDDDVIVMNKPAGVLTHSKGALNTESSVASFIKPMITDESMDDNRAGIVHRLDRATSGVIIAAKNKNTLKWLQKQFSTRRVKKNYLAIVEGVPSPTEAIIDAPIERNPKKPQTFRVGGGGRPAQTHYTVLKTLNPSTTLRAGKPYSLLELSPRTGRTHQLRVHLKYIGHPIVGDMVYGHGPENMYLHAKSLEITMPGGKAKIFSASEPKIFKIFEE
ncbi:RluA family pseudouridine synthase [Candidatus Saccharibacteria bacterium]|nr:RluA family pseudouridine synthase [Candidatus Saccharibacteria bacterium]